MKLTKFIHSCILAEDSDHVGLFDPGQFTWQSGKFSVDSLDRLDFVMITHEHPDHYCEPFVKALHHKFPDAMYFSTHEVVSKLKSLGVQKALSLSTEDVTVSPLAHESMSPLSPDPSTQNVAIHYKGKVSHPGDSHHLTSSKEVLLLPVEAPWGSTIDAVRMALSLKPKVVVPIHDWMWNQEWRSIMYDRMDQFFNQHDIRFVKPNDGESFEV